jgi:hypothetical protein
MAVTDLVTLDNTITFEGSGRAVLDSLVIETIDRNDIMEDHKMYAKMLSFVDTTLISPDQKFGTKSAGKGLQDITETGIKAQRDLTFGPKKGIYQKEIGDKFTMSFLFTQWSRNAKTIAGAPEGIQAELADMASNTRDLVVGYDIRHAEELVKVLTKGFSISAAEGPGSPTPKGLALFSASHTIAVGGTNSNLVTGASYTNIATGTTQLQAALDLHKKMKDENGKKVMQPRGEAYKLVCSRIREVFWKQVLNDGSNFSGQGSNANTMNQFNFKGNLVELVVCDLLGDLDYAGATIGGDDNWFVLNPTMIRKTKALRTYKLYSPRVKNWEDNETDMLNVSIRAVVGADHYSAELAVVGCQQ